MPEHIRKNTPLNYKNVREKKYLPWNLIDSELSLHKYLHSQT